MISSRPPAPFWLWRGPPDGGNGPDVASAKLGIESLSRARGPLSMYRATNCSDSLSWKGSPSHPPSASLRRDEYAEARVVLGEDLGYVIVSNELFLVELGEDTFSEGLCECCQVDL